MTQRNDEKIHNSTQSTTKNTKDLAKRISPKKTGDIMCSGRASICCSTCDTLRVASVSTRSS